VFVSVRVTAMDCVGVVVAGDEAIVSEAVPHWLVDEPSP
jgi:hypothetical protein